MPLWHCASAPLRSSDRTPEYHGKGAKALFSTQKAAKRANAAQAFAMISTGVTRSPEERRYEELERALHNLDECCGGSDDIAIALLSLALPLGYSRRHSRNAYGPTALHRLCRTGDIKQVELVLRHVLELSGEKSGKMSPHVRAMLDARDDSEGQRTPLLIALGHGHADLALALLQWGCDVCDTDVCGRNAVFQAIEFGESSSRSARGLGARY